jgi:hypothetical protein
MAEESAFVVIAPRGLEDDRIAQGGRRRAPRTLEIERVAKFINFPIRGSHLPTRPGDGLRQRAVVDGEERCEPSERMPIDVAE